MKSDRSRRRQLGTWASIPAACVLAAFAVVAVGSHTRHEAHTPVAPWDYVDQPNPNKIAHPGPVMADPRNIVAAKDNVVTTPDGITIRLNHVSKGNSTNWEHWWTPQGGPLTSKPEGFFPNNEDQLPFIDGRHRQLSFSIHMGALSDLAYIGYVPDGARSGLTEIEKNAHGWDSQSFLMTGSYNQEKKVDVIVDDPNASRFMFGISSGEWKTIDTAKSPLVKAPFGDTVIAKGPWGIAKVEPDPKNGPFATLRPRATLTVDLIPASEPINQALRLRAFDASGKEIPMTTNRNVATLRFAAPTTIASFSIEARPFVYYEFDGINYDPDPSLWKNMAWGSPPTEKVQIGDVTAELVAVVDTAPGHDDWSTDRYVGTKVFTIDNRVWKDHPDGYQHMSTPMTETFPKFNQKTYKFDPPTPLPRPMIAAVNFHWTSQEGGAEPVGRMFVFGSDSPNPGVDIHQDWNNSVVEWRHYGELQKIPGGMSVPFSLNEKANYVQIRYDIATGPYRKLLDVALDPEEIKPMGAKFRKFTLVAGPQVAFSHMDPGGKYISRVVSETKLIGMDTRVYAKMKSGERKLLALNSYSSSGSNDIWPAYDFDRDATETEGDVIALPQIEKFEIEARSIKQGYLVYKLPDGYKR